MLVCKNISWKPKGTKDQTSIENISFKIKQGEHLLILGPSGCGKTSLLKIIAGLLTPDSGNIQFDKVDIQQLEENKRDLFRGQNIGFIFQDFHLIKDFSTMQNLELVSDLSETDLSKEDFENILKSLNLLDKADAKVRDLSIGQMQRVSVARALVNSPKWILADEPTSSLDDENCHNLITLLEEKAKEQNSSLIIVTHDHRVKNHFTNQNIIEL